MNYLAHVALAEPSGEARLGALLGDFARGLDEQALPDAARYALEEHRALDRWFDGRDDVRAARAWFPAPLRRVAGILVDVFVDHALTRAWDQLGPAPLGDLTASLYRAIDDHARLLPPRLAAIGPRMASEDWLAGYGERRNVALALAGIERRLSRPTGIVEGIGVLDTHGEALDALTRRVFPEAQRWARERRRAAGRPVLG